MTKTIDTLVFDIEEVIRGNGGWTETVNEYFKESVGSTTLSRLSSKEERPKGTLRMSSIGQPCPRKLWYSLKVESAEITDPSLLFKFLYGDILEDLILALAVAAGHTVEGRQDELEIKGIKGHRDAVIDGVTVDVKSASSNSFKKFEKGLNDLTDDFGYLTQLPSYVFAAKDDPLVTDKEGGAFLVVDKQHGFIHLDYHNFKDDGRLDEVEKLYDERIAISKSSTPPKRGYDPEPEGASGNMKLGTSCSYCGFKQLCHPGLRTFLYKGPYGPYAKYLTKVVREPKVKEVKE